jgi:hypothetical protein
VAILPPRVLILCRATVGWVNWVLIVLWSGGSVLPSVEQLLAIELGSESDEGVLTALSFRIRLTMATILNVILGM